VTLIIGLTGGIGCGKSSAERIFARLGAGIIDTDQISRDLTQKDQPALAAICREFGAEYLLPDGNLDRARLRRRIFSDRSAKERLEAILHPLIRQRVVELIGLARAPYLLLVVPLLFETGAYQDLVDRVLVVDCDEAQQLERTMARSQLSADEVRAIMASQVSRADRLARADDVLPNLAGADRLEAAVAELHQRYFELSGKNVRS
jgi:dephospho-CoA kinase